MITNPLAADLLAALTPQASWEAYRDDPVGFFRDVLGLEPWTRQRDVLEAVLRYPRVVVRSGHKVGKSISAAGLALWWIATRPRSRVVLTSASYRQVRSILWRELRALYASASPPLGGELHAHPDAGLVFPDGREIVGFSTTEPERMSGISGANLLFILDEASGIPEEIFQAIEGNRAGGARLVLFSNPTRTSGTFFEAFGTKREFWHPIHISSEETPNAHEGRVVIPGLATCDWIDEKRREWGETSPLYQVRVRGDFPSQAENAIIPLALVEDATARWAETAEEGQLVLGVDVARFGDDETVIFPVRGRRALPPVIERKLDTVQVAGRVLEVARRLRADGERPIVRVDVIGVGAGVYDQLAQAPEVDVDAVNVAELPSGMENQERFALLRDQVWFGLAAWLKDSGAIPDDPKLAAELVAPTYTFDMRGRIKVETKDKIKERLGRSPDRADALGLAVVAPQGSFEGWSGYYRSVIQEADAQAARERPGAGVRNPQERPGMVRPGGRTIITYPGADEAARTAACVEYLRRWDQGEPIPWETLGAETAEQVNKMLGARLLQLSPIASDAQRMLLMERKRYTQLHPRGTETDDLLRRSGFTRR